MFVNKKELVMSSTQPVVQEVLMAALIQAAQRSVAETEKLKNSSCPHIVGFLIQLVIREVNSESAAMLMRLGMQREIISYDEDVAGLMKLCVEAQEGKPTQNYPASFYIRDVTLINMLADIASQHISDFFILEEKQMVNGNFYSYTTRLHCMAGSFSVILDRPAHQEYVLSGELFDVVGEGLATEYVWQCARNSWI